MRKYNTLFFSVCLFLFACGGKKAENNVIDTAKMVRLLTDIHVVDGRLYLSVSPDSLYKYGTGMYISLFKKYQTDSVQFRKSFAYYSSQPDELALMYDHVLRNLKKKTDSLNKLQLQQQPARPINALPQK